MGCKVSFFAVVASTLSLQSLATNYDALGYPDENGNFVLTEEGRKFWGRTPKTLGFSRFSALIGLRGSCGVERRGGCVAATFRWCGYDWRDSLYLG